ncbi:MAG: 50S ribosomal protein L12 [Candidatus Aenigmatarchaeota archaeon]
MNCIYGVLLLHSAGKKIDEDSLTKVMNATGEKVDPSLVKATITAISDVNIEEVISKAAMPVASAAPVAAVSEKKEDKSEEDTAKKAEEAVEGLGALFG